MSRPGTPGDELMLRAVADHFGVSVQRVRTCAVAVQSSLRTTLPLLTHLSPCFLLVRLPQMHVNIVSSDAFMW
jgi:hypothetical protein